VSSSTNLLHTDSLTKKGDAVRRPIYQIFIRMNTLSPSSVLGREAKLHSGLDTKHPLNLHLNCHWSIIVDLDQHMSSKLTLLSGNPQLSKC